MRSTGLISINPDGRGEGTMPHGSRSPDSPARVAQEEPVMKLLSKVAAACVLAAASTAFAAVDGTAPCAKDPKARGLPERLERMRDQMDRIEWATDKEEQRRLMDLHLKTMQEGMREVRRRDTTAECRMDMMQALMEQMMRHELVAHDSGL